MQKAPISVRIIHFLTQIVFWILLVMTGIVFVLNLILLTPVIDEDNFGQLGIQLPITFNVIETGSVQLFDKENEIRIDQATGKMHIVDTPIQLTKIVAKVMFAVMLLALFMTWKFRLFIINIKNGEIFEKVNINNLKHIAYGVLALWLVMKVYMSILYYTLVKRIEFSSIHLNHELLDYSEMILVAFLIWILAHIFIIGVDMKEEQELTI